jgi:hypothetical protein
MMSLYDNIQQVKNRAKAQILEADRCYSAAIMEIFTDDSR